MQAQAIATAQATKSTHSVPEKRTNRYTRLSHSFGRRRRGECDEKARSGKPRRTKLREATRRLPQVCIVGVSTGGTTRTLADSALRDSGNKETRETLEGYIIVLYDIKQLAMKIGTR